MTPEETLPEETPSPDEDTSVSEDTILVDLDALERQLHELEMLKMTVPAMKPTPGYIEHHEVRWLIAITRKLSAELRALRPPPPPKLPSVTDEELRTFVAAFCDGRIFTSAHLSEHEQGSLLGSVFMPLAFGAFEDWSETEIEEIGIIYEYLDQAGPRSVNGRPIFMSFRMLNQTDWKRAVEAIETEKERRKDIPV
jgi:hypothetical protein